MPRGAHLETATPLRPLSVVNVLWGRWNLSYVALGITAVVLAGAIVASSGSLLLVALSCGIAVFTVINAYSFEWVSPLLLMLGIFFVQPFLAGGNNLYTVGFVVLSCAAGTTLLSRSRVTKMDQPEPAFRATLLVSSMLWIWYVILAVERDGQLALRMRQGLAVVLTLAVATIVLRSHDRRRHFCLIFIGVIAAFCLSFALTFGLWVTTGFGTHVVGHLSVGRGPDSVQPIYFPFTPTNGFSFFKGHLIPRLTGPVREPGLMQAFILWAYFMLPRLQVSHRAVRWLRVALIVGLIGSQSTTGFGIFVFISVLYRFFLDAKEAKPPLSSGVRRDYIVRRLVGAILLVGATAVALNAPVLGFNAKSTSNATSISDRQTNTLPALGGLVLHPLGVYSVPSDNLNVAINTLAASRQIGVVGLVLALAMFILPLVRSSERRDALKPWLPLFITSIVAQPVLDAPGYLIAVMAAVATYDVARPRTADLALRGGRSSREGGGP